MSDQPPEDTPLFAVGRYDRIAQAQERGLVAASMDLPYWVIREGRQFVLYVEIEYGAIVSEEVAQFDHENTEREVETSAPAVTLPKVEPFSLFVAAWAMSTYWAVQNLVPPARIDLGEASNRAILQGEWWRTITALTLHGDFSHFMANLGFGLLFAAFLQPRMGGGVSWLLILLSGAFGNVMNSWFYRSEWHNSIGASTAVFGAVGLLTAWEFMARWTHPGMRNRWRLIVPIGGGLALLASLGAGDGTSFNQVDYMAHLWGFVAAVPLGLGAARFERAGAATQRLCAVAALMVPIVAWWFAWR